MNQIEAKALFSPCSDINRLEAFEMLEAAGITEIPWDSALDMEYAQWNYFNRK